MTGHWQADSVGAFISHSLAVRAAIPAYSILRASWSLDANDISRSHGSYASSEHG